jgi:cell wall-associated NlpC family hydrolase
VTSVSPVQSAVLIEQLTSDFSRLAGASSPASFLSVLASVQQSLEGAPSPASSGAASGVSTATLGVTAAQVPTQLVVPAAGMGTAGAGGAQASEDPRLAAVSAALGELGVPYVWGGASPATGFDCSGLVQWAYGQAGIALPRVASAQEQVGVPVPTLADAVPGDLVFYGNPAYHVGIYLGDGYMVDAPETGQTVSIQPVGTPTEIRRVTAGPIAGGAGVAGGYGPLFAQATAAYGLPPGLLEAVAAVESGMNPNAVSSAGAEGLMQLMPATAASLGVDPFDPAQAITGAAELLAGKIAKFASVPLALAAYNAGDGAVERYGGIPPYAQTQRYVAKVLNLMEGAASDLST